MEFTARSNDKKSRLRESSPSVRANHPRFARIILCESSDKPARIIHCVNHLVTVITHWNATFAETGRTEVPER